ncbi:MAG: glycerol-3-phosphate 1-O-acyltransferase PlsY [Terriglobia bacterium]
MWLGPTSLLLAYLVGAIPVGYLFVRRARGEDIREHGSGATGATNAARRAGAVGGLVTLLADAGKGYAAVELAARLTGGDARWVGAAAVAAIVGHCYPVYIGFRGGKGVATGLGVFLRLAPWGALAALAVWAVALAVWRYVALGSVLATAAFPLLAFALYRPGLPTTLAAVLAASVVILRHSENLRRLAAGTEPRITPKKRQR